jgi:membrane-bound lytic murein transglycosylase MltF
MAIMMTESSLNSTAVSSKNAVGLMQLTPIAVKEVERVYGLTPPSDLFDPSTNVLWGVLLLNHYNKVANNENELLALYNGGYRQLQRLRSGLPLAAETNNYINLVRDRNRFLVGLYNGPNAAGYRFLYSKPIEKALSQLRKHNWSIYERVQGQRTKDLVGQFWGTLPKSTYSAPSQGLFRAKTVCSAF